MAGKRIMLVEDDPDFIAIVRVLLESAGYQVFAAADSRAALAAIGAVGPNLILLDIMLDSDIAGFELAYQLRNPLAGAPYAAFASVPIVVLTSMGQTRQVDYSPRARLSFLPVNAYLEKPVDPEVLLATIAALLA
ncbi:MAG: response regulator [Candidatus Latescibacterota bacterium]|jgi:CheY-like chemotaxis protein